jgi:hypothetical protein
LGATLLTQGRYPAIPKQSPGMPGQVKESHRLPVTDLAIHPFTHRPDVRKHILLLMAICAGDGTIFGHGLFIKQHTAQVDTSFCQLVISRQDGFRKASNIKMIMGGIMTYLGAFIFACGKEE